MLLQGRQGLAPERAAAGAGPSSSRRFRADGCAAPGLQRRRRSVLVLASSDASFLQVEEVVRIRDAKPKTAQPAAKRVTQDGAFWVLHAPMPRSN